MPMKNIFTGLLLFSLGLSASAEPGGAYTLTGSEKSIFGIFQADMKAYPELYEGADVNACYKEFRRINDLNGGRKLKRGETLQFPHTAKSRAQAAAEKAAAEKEARAGQAASQPDSASEAADSSGLFGADRRGADDAALNQERARRQAVLDYQQNRLPRKIFSLDVPEINDETLEELIRAARGRVDDAFADALQLHRYPEKGIWILEFEPPAQPSGLFFFAAKTEADGTVSFYSLEKGLSIFGAGKGAKLIQWTSEWDTDALGGRDYQDCASFLAELERGPAL